MKRNLSRKEFFKTSAKYAAGATAGITGSSLLSSNKMNAYGASEWPLNYTKLDVEQCRKDAHDLFWLGGGCGFAGFAGIVNPLKALAQSSDPIMGIPPEMLKFAGGGAAGWGTLCGALNGASAAICLVTGSTDNPNYGALISELLGWYSQTSLPTDASNDLGSTSAYSENRVAEELPQHISGSSLCHASVTGWCEAAKNDTAYTGETGVDSLARKERCARLSGDVVAYAVQILNDAKDGAFATQYVAPTLIDTCNGCHGSTGMEANVASKMECSACHGDDTYPHTQIQSKIGHVEDNPQSYGLKENYPNPFNPSTIIEFSLPKRSNVNISVYDVHGRKVKDLVTNQDYPQGTMTVQWNGENHIGQKVASGTYFYRVQAGSFVATRKMMLMK